MGLLAQTKDVCDASVSFTYTAAATDFFPGVSSQISKQGDSVHDSGRQ